MVSTKRGNRDEVVPFKNVMGDKVEKYNQYLMLFKAFPFSNRFRP